MHRPAREERASRAARKIRAENSVLEKLAARRVASIHGRFYRQDSVPKGGIKVNVDESQEVIR